MSPGESNAPNFPLLISRFSGSSQWDRVLETAREWLSADPENSRAHLAAGQAFLNLQRFPEADSHLRRALAGEPENSTAHRFMSIALFHTKRFKEADAEAQKAISLSPHDHYNWYHLALMFYRQGDKTSAIKYARKARELAPRDADVINLIALCSPSERLTHYEEALELDPENAQVHNNIGAYHMNVTKDYTKAEECFRRALFFDPALKMARTNLFQALKRRDKVYHALCLPRDWMLQAFAFMRKTRKSNIALYIVLIPIWLYAFRLVLAGLILWCLLVWPMVKVYEFLTIGDIRHSAGEIGSRRGGFLGYRNWAVKTRLGIFGGCLVCFWLGLAGLIFYAAKSPEHQDALAVTAGLLFGIALFYLIFIQVRATFRKSRERRLSRKRKQQMKGVLETEMER